MENQDLVPYSEESQGSCSNNKAKLESDSIQAPSMGGQADRVKSTTKKSEIQCYKCKKYGHKCSACPNRKIRRQGEAHPSKKNKTENQGQVRGEEGHLGQLPTPEPYLHFLPIICFVCGKLGHKASMCPQKKKNKKRYQAPRSTSKAMQGSSTAFYNYPTSIPSGNYHNFNHYRTSKCPPNPSVVEMYLQPISIRLSFA